MQQTAVPQGRLRVFVDTNIIQGQGSAWHHPLTGYLLPLLLHPLRHFHRRQLVFLQQTPQTRP